MYSLVMMTALAGTPSSLEFNGYFRDKFLGNGCSGTSCTGVSQASSCSGCTGSTSNSCQGHSLFSGDRVRAFFNFNGNCCGSTSNSCQGSCTGAQYASCSGCSGSTYAAGCNGGMMMDYGTPYAIPSNATYYAGCLGGTAMPSTPYTGMPMNPMGPIAPTTIPPTQLPMGDGASPYAQPAPAEIREYTPKNQLPLPGGAAASPNRATIVVKVPVDSKLYAEGKALSLTGAERTFVSPELPKGQEFTYTFKIEYDRNGRTLSEQQNVKVTAGQLSTLEFKDLLQKSDATPMTNPIPVPMPKAETMPTLKTAATATSLPKTDATGDRARITVKLPVGATLFVNDAKQTTSDFKTPVLPRGQEFAYTMKIEVLRNGYPESVTQQVKIRAGDTTTVDFTTSGDTRSVSR